MQTQAAQGFAAIELLFVAAVVTTVSGIALPPLLRGLDDQRAAGAARCVATRLQQARMEAIRRSTAVAVRFADSGEFATFVDGNRNGVLSADIRDGIDPAIGANERLDANFSGVVFGTIPGLPAVDSGGLPPGGDPIHLGSSNLASFTPIGTSSSGSLYLRGRTRQLVVRIYGDTGKTRILGFDERSRQWKAL